MLKRLLKSIHRDEKGITGLETAIILIAFVVVASVFAYTVLSAGIFSSQKGQEAIYAGLEETRATMSLRGSVLGFTGNLTVGAGANQTLASVSFVLTNTLNGQAVDMSPAWQNSGNETHPTLSATGNMNVAVIAYIDSKQVIGDAAWSTSWIGKNDGDNLLESEEKVVIQVWLLANTGLDDQTFLVGNGTSDPWIDSNVNVLSVYDTFTVEVRPETGASIQIERTLPGKLDMVMDLN